ncbi:transposable element Tcb1 transposase [Trichonephila clavipes]|nr:transposable element Tcb1 transposase [Trichonephila clavipes]
MRDHTWHELPRRFFVNHQIELLPWPVRSSDLSPIENMWSMIAQRLTLDYTSSCHTRQRVEAVQSGLYPQEHIQSLFESMPRRVTPVISNNGGYPGFLILRRNHTSQKSINLIILYLVNMLSTKINFVVLSLCLSLELHLQWPAV